MSARLPLGAFLFFAVLAPAAAPSITATDDATPAPELGPSEVVRIQVAALQDNDAANQGIALAYRFAAPSSRRLTGALERFVRTVRSPRYERLLNHRSASFGPLIVSGDTARQMVTVVDRSGTASSYLWQLSRQRGGACANCWMTEAVLAAEAGPQRLASATRPAQPQRPAPVFG